MNQNKSQGLAKVDKNQLNADWDKVQKLSLEEQVRYFGALCRRILMEPMQNPVAIWLDYKQYFVDAKYETLLKSYYEQYKKLSIQLKEEKERANTYDIEWNKVYKMPISKRVLYFKSILAAIEKESITKPLAIKTEKGYSIINEYRYEIYQRCLYQYDKALHGVDVFAGEKKKKKSPKVFGDLLKKFENLLPTQKSQPSYTLNDKRNMSSGMATSVVACAMCATYVLSVVASAFSSTTKKEDTGAIEAQSARAMTVDDLYSIIENENSPQSKRDDTIQHYFDKKREEIERQLAEERARAEEEARIAAEQARIEEEKERRRTLMDSYIEEYCIYFNLDSAKVIEIARSKTNDYEQSLTTLFEPDNLYDGVDDEAACMVFVRQIFRNRLGFDLSELGLSTSDLSISNERYTLGTKSDGKIYLPNGEILKEGEHLFLRNGETREHFLGRVCNMINMDMYYTLAIHYHETWRGTSTLCINDNNYGGMRNKDGTWSSYPSPEAGIIAHYMNLKAYEKRKIQSWQRMADIYAEGSTNWIQEVKSFHSEIISDPESYFGDMDFDRPEEIKEPQEVTDTDGTPSEVLKDKVLVLEMN